MSLFGSKKEEKSFTKTIRPTVVRVQNVSKELLNLAKSYDIKVETLDFNLLEVQTYTRVKDSTNESEWQEVLKENFHEVSDEKNAFNPHFQIKQMYEIEIFSKNDEDDLYKDFHLAVGANATKCKVYLNIKADSKISYTKGIEQDLHILINKKKIRAGILIYIFDEMLDDVVSKIYAKIKVEENLVYNKNETILIAQSYEPTLTTNDELILHYEKKEDIDENAKIDYASRGYIQSVKKGELLIEYIKAKEGKPGRNCRGEYLLPKEPVISHTPTFAIDEKTIKKVETTKSIEYIAKENGYISFDANTYTIRTDVDVDMISFKTTGSISSGVDSDVNIVVKEKNAIRDAVGSGMLVEVSNIEVEGNVGPGAKIHALSVKIGGQTHKTSEIIADNIDINIHKGIARGKKIHVRRLEHGLVDCDFADVEQTLGGDIRAEEISILVCTSHVKATATKLIEIKKLQGSENVFIIDPILKKDSQVSLNENSEKIKEIKIELKNLEKEISKYSDILKSNSATFIEVKKRLIQYKKNGMKMPTTFVKKYKQYQKMQTHLEQLEDNYKAKEDHLKLLLANTSSFQNNICDARIINRDRWVGHNELIFKLVDPPMEISYVPPEDSAGKIFGLVEVEDGDYEIQVVKE